LRFLDDLGRKYRWCSRFLFSPVNLLQISDGMLLALITVRREESQMIVLSDLGDAVGVEGDS
jgi:hypothetical protein